LLCHLSPCQRSLRVRPFMRKATPGAVSGMSRRRRQRRDHKAHSVAAQAWPLIHWTMMSVPVPRYRAIPTSNRRDLMRLVSCRQRIAYGSNRSHARQESLPNKDPSMTLEKVKLLPRSDQIVLEVERSRGGHSGDAAANDGGIEGDVKAEHRVQVEGRPAAACEGPAGKVDAIVADSPQKRQGADACLLCVGQRVLVPDQLLDVLQRLISRHWAAPSSNRPHPLPVAMRSGPR
jgi:hypothetical protein